MIAGGVATDDGPDGKRQVESLDRVHHAQRSRCLLRSPTHGQARGVKNIQPVDLLRTGLTHARKQRRLHDALIHLLSALGAEALAVVNPFMQRLRG